MTIVGIHQPKISAMTISDRFNSPAANLAMVFGMAGHETNAQMAIEDCIEEIKVIPPEQRSLTNVTKALRKAILGINREYVDGRPEDQKFDLVIGCWVPRGGGLKLFSTNASAGSARRYDYDCVGTGFYIGHYLIRPVFDRKMTAREAILLAIQAFSAAKTYDSSCGGDTQFMTILPGGNLSAQVPFEIHSSERYIEDFQKASRQLLFDIGDGEMSDCVRYSGMAHVATLIWPPCC